MLVVVVAIWYALSYLLLEPRRRFLLPPPHDVLQTGFFDADNLGDILSALWASTKVALTGLVIAIIVGTAFAVAMSQARWVERSFYPWAVVLQTIPILALVPLVGFWFEYGFASRVFVCVLIALFPIVTNTLFGLKSADRAHHDLFSLYGATRPQRLLMLQFPGALPAIFTGWRISAGLAVIGAIVGDFFFRQGEPGIGRLIDGYTARLQSEELFAAIICSSLLGLAVFWAFGLLSRSRRRLVARLGAGRHARVIAATPSSTLPPEPPHTSGAPTMTFPPVSNPAASGVRRGRRFRRLLAFSAAAALVVAACGDDDEDCGASDTVGSTPVATDAPADTDGSRRHRGPGGHHAGYWRTGRHDGGDRAVGHDRARQVTARPRPSGTRRRSPGCAPTTVVFQTNWWPQPDHALAYQLIGPDGEVDTSTNSYSGPLGSTGVDLEIRAGGSRRSASSR